ncbi:MAG: ATP-binding protein [Treponema sp.]|jgi:signal transduction histidine kinase|nr:ATP-binding protein [Treponema sp.]
MKKKFTISLTSRLAATYALYICLVLGILAFLVNYFSGVFFTTLIKNNVAGKSREIVSAVEMQYNPSGICFDTAAVEAIGMLFVHEGFIISIEDNAGNIVWEARSCDMEQCVSVISSIAARMENNFSLNGSLRKEVYPLRYRNLSIGSVTIETYSPFFYSESEMEFLTSINRLLFLTGIFFIGISVFISAVLSRTIVKPILTAGKAAQKIARIYSEQTSQQFISIKEDYRTRELEELSRSINTLAWELEESRRRQKQLTSDIAHELRTPLSCLQVNLEAIIEGAYPMNKEQLESCLEEVLRLTALVKDLNTLTCLEWETITLNKTEFDLAKLLQITAEQFKSQAAEKGITINLNLAESKITADYDRLKQVFINILSNAVKYTDKGGITITIETANKASGPQYLVSIADTGIGIPEDDLPRIFERFYRGDKSRSRSTGGAGIGLTIAAAIVCAHGGTIEVKSGTTGTVFTVAL